MPHRLQNKSGQVKSSSLSWPKGQARPEERKNVAREREKEKEGGGVCMEGKSKRRSVEKGSSIWKNVYCF